MYKLATTLLLLLTCLTVNAKPEIFQIDKPVTCSDVKTVIEALSEKYNENPFWVGKSTDSKFILMVNLKTSTWSMVEYNDEIACIVGTGNKANQIFLKPSV